MLYPIQNSFVGGSYACHACSPPVGSTAPSLTTFWSAGALLFGEPTGGEAEVAYRRAMPQAMFTHILKALSDG